MEVLVVDDSAFIRRMLRDILETNGHAVVAEACDGEEAVEAYRESQPGLVTLDITMPNLDGIGALERIVELDPSARVIMVSALGQEEYIDRALELGAKDFIVKPFQPQRVADIVERVSRA